MKKMMLLSTVFWINSCIHRAPSLNMLDERADYSGKEDAKFSNLNLSDDEPFPEIKDGKANYQKPKQANIWIFAHRSNSNIKFWGGWITIDVLASQSTEKASVKK